MCFYIHFSFRRRVRSKVNGNKFFLDLLTKLQSYFTYLFYYTTKIQLTFVNVLVRQLLSSKTRSKDR